VRDAQSQARATAKDMLDHRGNANRQYRNTLIFLVADRNRLEDLKQSMRRFLAWDSICSDNEKLNINLDNFQKNQAQTKRDDAKKSVESIIPETYIWLLVPDQPDPRRPDELQEIKMQPQPQSSLATNASRRLRSEDMLITQYAGTLLRREMDRIPLWRGNHVTVKELSENFARYVYLPRLKNTEVLLRAIAEGVQTVYWQSEAFAYADSYDESRARYLGLKAGQQISVTLNATSVVVKPEVVAAQFAADTAQAAQSAVQATMAYTGGQPIQRAVSEQQSSIQNMPATPTTLAPMNPAQFLAGQPATIESKPQRFYGSVKIRPEMMAGDAGKIMEEVVQHLNALQKNGVKVTLEIQATIPNGIPADVVQIIKENCQTLHFEGFGFEEE